MDLSVYVITADVPELGRTHLDVARAALAGGASVIQFREKNRDRSDRESIAMRMCRLAHEAGAVLIVNDDSELAARIGADGVHVGQGDAPAEAARCAVGPGAIVGLSATSVDEATAADPEVLDYIGLGPIFATPSKDDAAPSIGLEGVRAVARLARVPIVAIGGVTMDSVKDVIAAGADGVAVISAVAQAPDMTGATRKLGRLIREAKERRAGSAMLGQAVPARVKGEAT